MSALIESKTGLRTHRSNVFSFFSHLELSISGFALPFRWVKDAAQGKRCSTRFLRFWTKTVSDPDLGRPDELGGDSMCILKLRSGSTRSRQPLSTDDNQQPSNVELCGQRKRHAPPVQPDPRTGTAPRTVCLHARARGLLSIFMSIYE